MLIQILRASMRRLRPVNLTSVFLLTFAAASLRAQVPPPKPCFDFTGTGRTSFATVTGRGIPGNMVWNVLSNGGDGSVEIYPFGISGIELSDGLSPGYFDADDRADAGVYRDSSPFGQPGA